MHTETSLARLFEFDYWASRAALESLGDQQPGSRPLRLMAHILGAQRVWISRLRGVESPLAVWPELDVDGCRRALEQLRTDWGTYISEPTEVLDKVVGYRNTQGSLYETAPREILMHVILHGQYHRGQIASAIREQGGTPAIVDYIAYVRE